MLESNLLKDPCNCGVSCETTDRIDTARIAIEKPKERTGDEESANAVTANGRVCDHEIDAPIATGHRFPQMVVQKYQHPRDRSSLSLEAGCLDFRGRDKTAHHFCALLVTVGEVYYWVEQ